MNHTRVADWVTIWVVHLPERTETGGLNYRMRAVHSWFRTKVCDFWQCGILWCNVSTTLNQATFEHCFKPNWPPAQRSHAALGPFGLGILSVFNNKLGKIVQ